MSLVCPLGVALTALPFIIACPSTGRHTQKHRSLRGQHIVSPSFLLMQEAILPPPQHPTRVRAGLTPSLYDAGAKNHQAFCNDLRLAAYCFLKWVACICHGRSTITTGPRSACTSTVVPKIWTRMSVNVPPQATPWQEGVLHTHTAKCGSGQAASAAAAANANLLPASVTLAHAHADAATAPVRRNAGGCASTTPYMDPASLPSSTSCSMPYSGSAALSRALPHYHSCLLSTASVAPNSAMLC